MAKKSGKCIQASDIWYWTIVGYIAYTAVLYIYRKPACEYAKSICEKANSNG